MTAPSPRPEYLAPVDFDPAPVREIRVSESGEPLLVEDGKVLVGMWDTDQSVWRLLVEGVAVRAAFQRTTAVVDRWREEAKGRGPEDTLLTNGAVDMLDHALRIEGAAQ